MAGKPLETVAFTRAMAIDRMLPRATGQGVAKRRCWLVIGRVGGQVPFLLSYQEGGATQWTCERGLGDGLRKKILGHLRTQLRQASALASYASVHDLTHLGVREADEPAQQLWTQFYDQDWRAQTLNDRDEDWLELRVPFAEKDQAKAAGARWDAGKKAWLARKVDRANFARWL